MELYAVEKSGSENSDHFPGRANSERFIRPKIVGVAAHTRKVTDFLSLLLWPIYV